MQCQSQGIGEFIEWLGENGMAICTFEVGLRGTRFFPILESTEQLLARHFEVDLNAVERERRQVLSEADAAHLTALGLAGSTVKGSPYVSHLKRHGECVRSAARRPVAA